MGQGRTTLDNSSQGWIDWELDTLNNLKFVWTPGHKRIKGNEIADREAKRAAKGQSSKDKLLPAFLRRKPLPVSISATRQFLKKKIKAQWQTEWSSSPRFLRMKAINPSLPSDDFLNIASQLCCNQVSLLFQLRSGHIPLNETLHQIKHSDTPLCPHCCGSTKETVHYFLLACPRYACARRLLQSQLRHSSSISFLLNSRSAIPNLLRYVSNTNHLRVTFREVCPADNFVLEVKHAKKTSS